MRKYLVAFMLALSMALVGLAGPAIAHEQPENTMLWKGCLIGLENLCPILAADAAGGDPAAQFAMAMYFLNKNPSEDSVKVAAGLVYESATRGYAPALALWERIVGRAPNKQEATPEGRRAISKYLIAQRE